MRALFYPFIIWLAAVQLPLAPHLESLQQFALVVTIAGALSTLTVLVYRLGGWRQEMEHLKHNLAGEVTRHSEESSRSFARLDDRFTAIDRFMAAANDQRIATERWQSRIEARLEGVESRLSRIESLADQEAA